MRVFYSSNELQGLPFSAEEEFLLNIFLAVYSVLSPGFPVKMCNGCVQKEYPDRGNTCLENGSYLMNYLGCANCHQRDFVLISNKATEDDDGEEIVTYDRSCEEERITRLFYNSPKDDVCKNCDHVIARHEYTFSVVDEYQEYTMLCMLCGKAEDSISVLPDDPRQSAPLF